MLGILIITLMSFIFSLLLVVTNYYLNQVDPRIEEVLGLLPGYNCGACGFAGCPGLAEQIVKAGISPRKCKPMKKEQYEKLTAYLKENKIEYEE